MNQLPATAMAIGIVVMAYNHIPGWGWLLFFMVPVSAVCAVTGLNVTGKVKKD